MQISIVDKTRAHEIAALAVCLTDEISDRTGVKAFDVDVPLATELCRRYMDNGQYTVFAASKAEKIVAFGALCESHSLYAEGSFGIIQEFYVVPEVRSKGLGSRLMDAMVAYARQKGWKRLELCTPPVPDFESTLHFYQKNGFEITGGHKMKKPI